MSAPVRVHLESPAPRHQVPFLAAARCSVKLHGRFARAPRTAVEYRALLARARDPRYLPHLVVGDAGEICGVITLSELVRGAFQSAYLGYYAFAPHAGKGRMRAGLELVLERAFGRHRLHRVEANLQPDNHRSRALVRGLGFALEGYSPRYLKIAGRWRDHERWALLREDYRRDRVRKARAPRVAGARAPRR